jgi:hypothetical protein
MLLPEGTVANAVAGRTVVNAGAAGILVYAIVVGGTVAVASRNVALALPMGSIFMLLLVLPV